MKYLFLFCIVLLSSCTKETTQTPIEPQKPVLIQIEAIYIDGNSDVSKVVLVR